MELQNYLAKLEKNWAALPIEKAVRSILELGRLRDGIYLLPSSNGEELSIRRSYDDMLALDIRAELENGIKWMHECLSLPEFTNEHVHLCYAMGWGRVPQPRAHKAIYNRLTEEEIIPYELCDRNNGDIDLPIPKSRITAIHEIYHREFGKKGWDIEWTDEPNNEPFDSPDDDTFFLYELQRCWASLLITHAALNIPRDKLLRGNRIFQLAVTVHDTTFLVGEICKDGFIGLGELLEKYQ